MNWVVFSGYLEKMLKVKMLIAISKEAQYSANMNVLGANIFFYVIIRLPNLENQNLHNILVQMVYNNSYILHDQISGIFKGTWEKRDFE